jgi:cysteinyl-tRNA synthetase
LQFSFEALDGAKNTFNRLREKVIEIKEKAALKEPELEEKEHEYEEEFVKAINDDLNMPIALSVLWSVVKDEEISDREKLRLLLEFDKVLGFGFAAWKHEKVDAPSEVMSLLKQRDDARKNKEWKKSDEIRDKIKSMGYLVLDGKDGQEIKKI